MRHCFWEQRRLCHLEREQRTAPHQFRRAEARPKDLMEPTHFVRFGIFEPASVARLPNAAALVPASRRKIFQKLQPLAIKTCPFVNLPETGRSRWGEILTAEKMKQCVWVEPKASAQIEFLERNEGGRVG